MAIPIFLIHWGNSDYLKYCLHQARLYNPKSEIILIGDRSNNKYPFVRHYNVSGYSFNANIFLKNYVHLNTSVPAWYVKLWFKRWFVLRDFIRMHSYGEQFVYIDSDVLLYCDVTKEFEKFKNFSMTICGQSAPHCIFFSSAKPLEELCDLITAMFTEPGQLKILTDKYEHHISGNKLGGVDDMTAILEYGKQHPGQIGDNSTIINGTTYEEACFLSEGYEYNVKTHTKKIYWKDGYPYGKHLPDGNLVKFNALHFQGGAKSLMHNYYTGENMRLQKIFSRLYYNYYGPLRKKLSKLNQVIP